MLFTDKLIKIRLQGVAVISDVHKEDISETSLIIPASSLGTKLLRLEVLEKQIIDWQTTKIQKKNLFYREV